MFTVYSTNCPNCRVLLKKLALKNKQAGVDFELVEDIDKVNEVALQYDIQSAPFIIKDNVPYLFGDAMKLINEMDAEGCESCKLN